VRKLKLARPVGEEDDYVAAIGDNRKLLVFPLAELPRWRAGRAFSSSAIATADCPMRSPSASPRD
jgi:hypothetical protein